jgi:hypothetical protein
MIFFSMSPRTQPTPRAAYHPFAMGNHALIFGASGISGWAITNALLEGYPSPDLFSKVSALTNRPLPPEVAQWPSSHKLQVVSGVDLLQSGGQKALEDELRTRVTDIEGVTHVYFFCMSGHLEN